MQKFPFRSVLFFGLWLLTTIIGYTGGGIAFGADKGPLELGHSNIAQVTEQLTHHNAQVWYINGQPIMQQQETQVAGFSSKLNLLDTESLNAHLSQSVRASLRQTVSTTAKRRNLSNSIIAYIPEISDNASLFYSTEDAQKSILHLLIDPKKITLGVQTRWGVRTDWSTRSSVVQLIHSALLKDEGAKV